MFADAISVLSIMSSECDTIGVPYSIIKFSHLKHKNSILKQKLIEKHTCGSCVDFPEPVSPTRTSVWNFSKRYRMWFLYWNMGSFLRWSSTERWLKRLYTKLVWLSWSALIFFSVVGSMGLFESWLTVEYVGSSAAKFNSNQ